MEPLTTTTAINSVGARRLGAAKRKGSDPFLLAALGRAHGEGTEDGGAGMVTSWRWNPPLRRLTGKERDPAHLNPNRPVIRPGVLDGARNKRIAHDFDGRSLAQLHVGQVEHVFQV